MRQGNRKAFEIIYNNEVDALLNYGKKFTKDENLIEDAIHDVFIYIWQKKEGLNELTQIRPYLFVSLRHKILNVSKKQQKTEHKEINDSFLDKEVSVEDRLIDDEFQVELSTKVKKSFEVLSNRQKEAIYLRYQSNMAYEDICKVMDISYQSVRNLISTGVKKLQTHLKEKK
ncbi:MAG: sigma-70 family RNA polymerase sigma factor [Saprospiraceae bacterium]|nr:sigma-70 family RNA polymerase sigma factor [Saprospiraceae bacterium]